MANVWPPKEQLKIQLASLIGDSSAAPFVVGWEGTTFRFASRDYADRQRFTDGEGARRNTGRFTPIGGPRTLYLSLDRATATTELDSWFEYYNVPDTAFQPRVLAAVSINVQLLLDLTATETLTKLGLTAAQVGDEWRSISDGGGIATTQSFGRLIFDVGFEGLRYRSSRRENGVNFALFPENYRDGSHATMLNSE